MKKTLIMLMLLLAISCLFGACDGDAPSSENVPSEGTPSPEDGSSVEGTSPVAPPENVSIVDSWDVSATQDGSLMGYLYDSSHSLDELLPLSAAGHAPAYTMEFRGKGDIRMDESKWEKYAENIENVIVGEGIRSFPEYFLELFPCVSKLSLPESLRGLDGLALSGTSITGDTEYGNALYIGNAANPHLMLLCAKNTDITSVTVHKDCKFIADGAFYLCESLEDVTFEEGISLTAIYPAAFACCTALTEITFAAGSQLESIGDEVFRNSGLLSIILPSSVMRISAMAFDGSAIQSVIFEEAEGWFYSDGGLSVDNKEDAAISVDLIANSNRAAGFVTHNHYYRYLMRIVN